MPLSRVAVRSVDSHHVYAVFGGLARTATELHGDVVLYRSFTDVGIRAEAVPPRAAAPRGHAPREIEAHQARACGTAMLAKFRWQNRTQQRCRSVFR